MADDYSLTHEMCCKSGNPQQKRYYGSGIRENISRMCCKSGNSQQKRYYGSGIRANISRNMDDRDKVSVLRM